MKGFMGDMKKGAFLKPGNKAIFHKFVGFLVSVVYIGALPDTGGGRGYSSRPPTSSGWRQQNHNRPSWL
jgi:hypothetical protein